MSLEAGDPLTFACDFRVDGVLTDPSTVTLTITAPDEVETTYTYSGGEITREGVGRYSKTVTAVAGWYFWRWAGTGAAQAVDQGAVEVAPSIVA
jgi:hypothetical protein